MEDLDFYLYPKRLNSIGEILDLRCNILVGQAKLCGDRAPASARVLIETKI